MIPVTYRQTDRHFDPVLDHFGIATVVIHENARSQTEIATAAVTTLFWNLSRQHFTVCYSICASPKVSHNQHPAGPELKKHAGRKKCK